MILSNVNIGTGPSVGDGDPLRTAFSTINNNFQYIVNNVNVLTNSVSRVAGRTGNITLTTLDIVGINNYATTSYVNSQLGNVGTYSNVNVTAFLPSYSGSIATVTTANLAMKGYVDASIAGLVDSAPGALDTLNELAAALGDDPNLSVTLTNTITNSNTSLKNYVDGQISAVNVSVSSANVGLKGYVDQANTIQATAISQANLGMKGYVDSVAGQGDYANANVAAYLVSYTGNIAVNTLKFDDLSEQHTAYTGTQWRSNLSSNVTVKPSWMSYYPGLKNQLGTQYGFDASGMFFNGNADNDIAYPIRTNLHIHGEDTTEIIATINFAHTGDDHGIAIFNSDSVPIWKYSTDTTRIAFQFSSGTPRLYGQTTQDISGTPVVTAGNTYTIKFTYSPGNTVTVQTYAGTDTSGSLLDTRTISEILPTGDYVIGFDADQDVVSDKSYFTNIIIRTLTNTVVNNLEVQGQVTGNLIPSANVTYSLGNITHQWNDLFVSNTTIYVGGVPISVDSGANLLVNGTAIPKFSAGNVFVLPGGNVNLTPDDGFLNINTSHGGAIEMNDGTGNVGAMGIESGTNAYITIDDGLGGGAKLWTFDPAGTLTFPASQAAIYGGIDNDFIINTANTNAATYSFTFTQLGNFSVPVDLTVANAAYTSTLVGYNGNLTVTATTHNWQFDNTGVLTLPNNSAIIPVGNTGVRLSAGIGDTTGLLLNNTGDAEIYAFGNLSIYTDSDNAGQNWTFDNAGELTFPDSTTQTTAWTGSIGNIRSGTSNVKITSTNGNIDFNVNGALYGTLGSGVVALGYRQYPHSGNSSVIAIGTDSGLVGQKNYAIGIGVRAGWVNQGQYSVAIGYDAGKTSQVDNSIAINASGLPLDTTTAGLYINPVRQDDSSVANIVYYNTSTKEMTYGPTVGSSYSNVQAESFITTFSGNVPQASLAYSVNISPVFLNQEYHMAILPAKQGAYGVKAADGTANVTYNPVQNRLTVNSISAGNISAGNVFASGTSGRIGYTNGGFVQQTTSNANGVSLNTISGNIQLMGINLGVNSLHTVAFSNNKLEENDMILITHHSGGVTNFAVGAYYFSAGTALIWIRNITGADTATVTPMLKFAIIKAPGS